MTTDKYSELIEKEAEIRSTKYTGFGKGCIKDIGAKSAFIDGIHSELNNRIIEIEKREFAIEVLLQQLLNLDENSSAFKYMNYKIQRLQSELTELKNKNK